MNDVSKKDITFWIFWRMGNLRSLVVIVVIVVALIIFESHATDSWSEKCTTRWFRQKKDHFAFKSESDQNFFSQRVLFNLDSYKPDGVIFFYFGKQLTCRTLPGLI